MTPFRETYTVLTSANVPLTYTLWSDVLNLLDTLLPHHDLWEFTLPFTLRQDADFLEVLDTRDQRTIALISIEREVSE